MRFDFRHPVIASGIHAKSLLQRVMVGMVSTPVEVQDLSSSEVVTAFDVESVGPANDFKVIQHDGLLYKKADFDLGVLLGADTDFEKLEREIKSRKLPFRPLGDALASRIHEIAALGSTASLLPTPRSPMIAGREIPADYAIVPYLSKTRPIPAAADVGEIEVWRDAARRFSENFIIVDGQTYHRTGVPIYCAGNTAIQPISTNIFARYMDVTLTSRYGGTRPSGYFRTFRGVAFRASELREARRIRHDMARTTSVEEPLLDSQRIIPHVDVPITDLEHLDLVRFAKIHLYEAKNTLDDYSLRWGEKVNARTLSNPETRESRYRSAANALKEALDAHELRGDDIECVEGAMRTLAPLTMENRFTHADADIKQKRCRYLDVATKVMFERLEAMSINVPVFTERKASLGL
jgi:hypothetical protein